MAITDVSSDAPKFWPLFHEIWLELMSYIAFPQNGARQNAHRNHPQGSVSRKHLSINGCNSLKKKSRVTVTTLSPRISMSMHCMTSWKKKHTTFLTRSWLKTGHYKGVHLLQLVKFWCKRMFIEPPAFPRPQVSSRLQQMADSDTCWRMTDSK